MRRASWRQQGDAACLVEATGRCGVPRGGSGGDAMCLREATGRSNVPRKATWGERPLGAYATSRRLPQAWIPAC